MPPIGSGEFLLPLFPLPNLVFFPHTRVPLHIFEPRYREMIGDALQGDRRIGIVLLKPGWETNYFGAPPVYQCGTLGSIERAITLDDGRYNLVLRGDLRFRIVETVSDEPYRVAKVTTLTDRTLTPAEAYAHRQWLADLSRIYLELLPGEATVPELASASLDALTNALVMSLNITPADKQELLELDDVARRANRVGKILEERIGAMKFLGPYRPPSDPSSN